MKTRGQLPPPPPPHNTPPLFFNPTHPTSSTKNIKKDAEKYFCFPRPQERRKKEHDADTPPPPPPNIQLSTVVYKQFAVSLCQTQLTLGQGLLTGNQFHFRILLNWHTQR